MNFDQLLLQRQMLLRQARLANLAFAYQQLAGFAARVARGGLTGLVRLTESAPGPEGYWAMLTALEGSQAVIEEHFTDEDIVDLAELLAYATDSEEVDETFRLEQLGVRYLTPLRRELEQSGVVLPDAAAFAGQPAQDPLNWDAGN